MPSLSCSCRRVREFQLLTSLRSRLLCGARKQMHMARISYLPYRRRHWPGRCQLAYGQPWEAYILQMQRLMLVTAMLLYTHLLSHCSLQPAQTLDCLLLLLPASRGTWAEVALHFTCPSIRPLPQPWRQVHWRLPLCSAAALQSGLQSGCPVPHHVTGSPFHLPLGIGIRTNITIPDRLV